MNDGLHVARHITQPADILSVIQANERKLNTKVHAKKVACIFLHALL